MCPSLDKPDDVMEVIFEGWRSDAPVPSWFLVKKIQKRFAFALQCELSLAHVGKFSSSFSRGRAKIVVFPWPIYALQRAIYLWQEKKLSAFFTFWVLSAVLCT